MKFKKIYREPRVEWMKPRIKSMIWNIKKQKTIMLNDKKKKEYKKMRIVLAACGTTLSNPTFASQGCQKKRKSKKLENYLKK